jgi:succinate dehydrogenase / fumarate reductase membrane anchor subunit
MWLSAPINTLALILWISTVCYHAALGLQVVIEDYVATLQWQKMAIIAVQLSMLVLALAALTAVIQIFITG